MHALKDRFVTMAAISTYPDFLVNIMIGGVPLREYNDDGAGDDSSDALISINWHLRASYIDSAHTSYCTEDFTSSVSNNLHVVSHEHLQAEMRTTS